MVWLLHAVSAVQQSGSRWRTKRNAAPSAEFSLQSPGAQEWEWQLEELALYFLLWSEAANLRHLPECLWFLYWILRNSHIKMAEVALRPTALPCGKCLLLPALCVWCTLHEMERSAYLRLSCVIDTAEPSLCVPVPQLVVEVTRSVCRSAARVRTSGTAAPAP